MVLGMGLLQQGECGGGTDFYTGGGLLYRELVLAPFFMSGLSKSPPCHEFAT